MYTNVMKRFWKAFLLSLLLLVAPSLPIPSASIHAETLRTPDGVNDRAYITQEEIDELWSRAEKRAVEDDKSDTIGEKKTNTSEKLTNPKKSASKNRNEKGTYPTRKGVILVTKHKFRSIIPLGHVAIVYNSNIVIEAFGNGVQYGRNDRNISRKTAYGVSVKKTTKHQDAQAAEWCKNQIGKPYNFNYLNTRTRDRFYCSQLIWAAYFDNYGINIDTPAWGHAIHPSEILNSNEISIIYRQS